MAAHLPHFHPVKLSKIVSNGGFYQNGEDLLLRVYLESYTIGMQG
jgi:hypothetical protein